MKHSDEISVYEFMAQFREDELALDNPSFLSEIQKSEIQERHNDHLAFLQTTRDSLDFTLNGTKYFIEQDKSTLESLVLTSEFYKTVNNLTGGNDRNFINMLYPDSIRRDEVNGKLTMLYNINTVQQSMLAYHSQTVTIDDVSRSNDFINRTMTAYNIDRNHIGTHADHLASELHHFGNRLNLIVKIDRDRYYESNMPVERALERHNQPEISDSSKDNERIAQNNIMLQRLRDEQVLEEQRQLQKKYEEEKYYEEQQYLQQKQQELSPEEIQKRDEMVRNTITTIAVTQAAAYFIKMNSSVYIQHFGDGTALVSVSPEALKANPEIQKKIDSEVKNGNISIYALPQETTNDPAKALGSGSRVVLVEVGELGTREKQQGVIETPKKIQMELQQINPKIFDVQAFLDELNRAKLEKDKQDIRHKLNLVKNGIDRSL